MTTAATQAEHWHVHRSGCNIPLIYAHRTLRIVQTYDISLGWQTLPAQQAGDFVELLPLYYH
jgi:hypothetical protein